MELAASTSAKRVKSRGEGRAPANGSAIRGMPVASRASLRFLLLRYARRTNNKTCGQSQKETPSVRMVFLSVSINPHPCHSEPVTDVTGVGIRNLLDGNLRKSAGIMRFGNGLPRQCAHWLAMTGYFDSLRNTAQRAVFL